MIIVVLQHVAEAGTARTASQSVSVRAVPVTLRLGSVSVKLARLDLVVRKVGRPFYLLSFWYCLIFTQPCYLDVLLNED